MGVPRGPRPPAGGPAEGESSTVTVRLTPRASRDGIDGMEGGVLRVRLTTPPVDDRANEALIRFLAAAAGVPRRDVTLAAGRRGRTKIVRIGGVSAAEFLRRLGL